MDLTNKENKDFSELCHLVKDGDEQGVYDWFEKHKISRRPRLQRDLTQRILNTHYFFSFQSYSTNSKFIENERLRRELSILSNLKPENQLLLFNVTCIEDMDSRHFSVMRLNKKEKESLIKNNKIVSIITKLLNEEKFDEIKKINKLLGWNTLEQKSELISFYYKERSGRGSLHFKINEPYFDPTFDIVFNFTEEKKNFIESTGIKIPTIEEAEKLYYLMITTLKNDSWLNREENIEKVENFIKTYKVYKNFSDINESLGYGSIESKKIKNKI